MQLRQLLKDIEIQGCRADLETEISGISYDSRQTQPGDLFVAIKGFDTDGHRYIGAAMEKGAAAVLCEEPPEGAVPWVRTADSRLGLALASRELFGNAASQMKLIGLTGTNGKTSSSYLIKHLLEHFPGVRVGLIGTNGVMIGDSFLHAERTTPESYELQKLFRQMADAGCTHVVMEVSSHSLSLKRVAGIHFDLGVFTNLSQDHLDFHGSMEEYAAAKRQLFSQWEMGLFNLDDPWAAFMMEGAGCVCRGYSAENNAASLVAKDIRLSASSVRFAAVSGSEIAMVRLGLPGMFSVHNALCVLAVGQALGYSLVDCAKALESAKGVKGRVEPLPTDGDYTILIDYAHTPDALENVLKTLKGVTRGRLICLFGCGGDRDKGKRPLMGEIAERYADLSIVTSDNPRTEDPMEIIREILQGMKNSRAAVKVICDRIEAIHWAIDKAEAGDVILLAGKGHEDYQELGHVKRHMDEREIVADCLNERKKRAESREA